MINHAFTGTSHFVQPTLMNYVPSLKAEKNKVFFIFCFLSSAEVNSIHWSLELFPLQNLHCNINL